MILDQFANPDNPLRALRTAPGPEIWRDTEGTITHFVAAMGTTGTIMGCSRYLKEKNPADPDHRRAAGGRRSQIPGIRKWPEAYLPKIFDAHARRPRESRSRRTTREEMTRRLAREEGIFAGISSGRRAAPRRCAIAQEVKNAAIVLHRLRPRRPLPVHRRVPGLASMVPDPGLRHRDDPRRRGAAQALGPGRELSDGGVVGPGVRRSAASATGNDFLPHSPAARGGRSSCVLRSNDGLRVWSLGEPEDTEAELIQRFFDGIEKYTPQLVSWNGGGFDLPVLHYRALIHGVPAPRYWDTGDDDRDFKWNNYLEPLPRAPHRPDGRIGGLPATRHGAARRDRTTAAGFRASSAWTAARSCGRRGSAGEIADDPQLLRDRRRQHLPSLPALPADPRRAFGGRVRRRDRADARAHRSVGRAALEGIHRGVGRRVTMR